MVNIEINDSVYQIHPIYNQYGANENGEIVNISRKVPMKGRKNHHGYMRCDVRNNVGFKKNYQVHRFIWECYNGIIPEGKQIDHINDIRDDNRLCNLQLLTPKENSKKAAKNRDYTQTVENFKNVKCVKAINIETKEVSYYNSMYAAEKHLGIDHSIVRRVCNGDYGWKSGRSKKDGKSYKFEYVKEEDLPDNYLKYANKRLRRLTVEEKKKSHYEACKKWKKKEWKCPRCDKIIKNNSKYIHNKICV